MNDFIRLGDNEYPPVGAIRYSAYWHSISIVQDVYGDDGQWIAEVTIDRPNQPLRRHMTPFERGRDQVLGTVLGNPVHRHDCDSTHGCTYLGTFKVGRSERNLGERAQERIYDAWVHRGSGGSYIARMGEDGEYLSCSSSATGDLGSPLMIVRHLAQFWERFPNFPTI